ncbi:MAG: hypothetical protein ACR2G3_02575 [Solirubrobacterales bacterium]
MAETLRLELGAGAAVEWDLAELMHAADAADPQAPPAWELHEEPDWERISSLRLVVGAVGEQALAAAVARPAASSDHGMDGVALALVSAEGADQADEVLLSTEYDSEGAIRRLGIEIWLASGAGKRIAADRVGEAATGEAAGLRRTVTPVEVRLDGERGRGLHELIQPA